MSDSYFPPAVIVIGSIVVGIRMLMKWQVTTNMAVHDGAVGKPMGEYVIRWEGN
jgi:hypothetical protein